MQIITAEQGKLLVKFARTTIAGQLDESIGSGDAELEKRLQEPAFQEKRGVFVTLHKEGQLRGCIGSLAASGSIIEGVKDNAINAAFKDYRFPPLRLEELDLVDLEVSILTEPENLDYSGPDDLLSKLRPQVDGVIIHKEGRSATFLPQVWKQLPDGASFLSHLCQKAGLPEDQWRSGDLQVKTYQVLSFAEKE